MAALLGLSSLSMSAAIKLPKTGLAGSTHDIGANGCKSCHAPHNGATANGGAQSPGLILLWSRSFPASANTFGIYDSASMGNKAVELGGSALATSTDVRMYSLSRQILSAIYSKDGGQSIIQTPPVTSPATMTVMVAATAA